MTPRPGRFDIRDRRRDLRPLFLKPKAGSLNQICLVTGSAAHRHNSMSTLPTIHRLTLFLSALVAVVALPSRAGAQDPARAPAPTYASDRVRALVARAAAASERPPAGLESFAAHVESEVGVLTRRPDGGEVPAQLEQMAGRVAWWADGSMVQTVTRYRARALGVTFSMLTVMDVPWVIGPLYGDRVPVAFAKDSAARKDNGASRPAGDSAADAAGPPPKRLVHPFAADRAQYYRFSGGDTALVLQLPERTVTVVRVHVEAVAVPRDALVFEGDVDLDAANMQIVRLHGRVLERPRRASLLTALARTALQGFWFVDLENAEWEGTAWLPHHQWIELEVKSGFTDDRAVLRLITDFTGIVLNPSLPPPDSGDGAALPARTLRVATSDSLQGPGVWRRELGAATADASPHAFDDVQPPQLRPGGPPQVRFGVRGLSDAVRYDRVEGLFTGVGARLDFRDAAPGARLDLHGGYAWAESALRGGAEASLRRPGWSTALRVRRVLASTNDFPRPFAARPSILGVFGIDDFDYVDRSAAELSAGLVGPRHTALAVAFAVVRDAAPAVHLVDAPLAGAYRPLRPVTPGDYRRVRIQGRLGGDAGGEYLAPGLGAGASWELARGDLDWQRVEVYVRERSQRQHWILAGEVYAGTVFGDPPPPQSLFELGGYAGRLPGFDYKAFTGDRAAAGTLSASYALPLLDAPIRVRRLFLPALAPAPAVEVGAGWAGASPRIAGLMDTYGWTDSGGVRATVFLGLRVFGGAMGFGVARPLGEPGPWRLSLALDAGG